MIVPTAMFKDTFQAESCAPKLKALAEPVRLRIVDSLRSGAMSVGEIAAALDLTIVKVSHHLGILKHAGLVVGCRDGKHIIYRLAKGVTPAGSRSNPQINLGCCQVVVLK